MPYNKEALDERLAKGEEVKLWTDNPRFEDEGQERYIVVKKKVDEETYLADFNIRDVQGERETSASVVTKFYSNYRVQPSLF